MTGFDYPRPSDELSEALSILDLRSDAPGIAPYHNDVKAILDDTVTTLDGLSARYTARLGIYPSKSLTHDLAWELHRTLNRAALALSDDAEYLIRRAMKEQP